MPARAYWKGYLRLSLVTIGVELHSAVAGSKGAEMHQIHEPTGKRIRYQKIAPGVGPVPNEEIVKGVEVGKDEYVILEPEELDAIKLESKRTIDLVRFVDEGAIDPRYFEKPYYVVPADEEVAAEGFAVIREALRGAGKIGLGQMAVRGRDSIVAIKPCGDGLLLETLRYEDELRKSDSVFADIPDVKISKEMISLASELVERKSGDFDPGEFKSQYDKALRELINEKRKTGHVSEVSEEELQRPGNVLDLMEALKRSVKGGGEPPAKSKKAAPRRAAHRASSPRAKSKKRAAG